MGKLLFCAFVFLASVPGCVRSSSETPLPLEPDFDRVKRPSSMKRQVSFIGEEAVKKARESDVPISTWGVRRDLREDELPELPPEEGTNGLQLDPGDDGAPSVDEPLEAP